MTFYEYVIKKTNEDPEFIKRYNISLYNKLLGEYEWQKAKVSNMSAHAKAINAFPGGDT